MPCSAPTALARPPPCAWSPACCSLTAAKSRSAASTRGCNPIAGEKPHRLAARRAAALRQAGAAGISRIRGGPVGHGARRRRPPGGRPVAPPQPVGAARPALRRIFAGHAAETALAGALIHEPRLLMLDEPLTGLDAGAARAVKDMLQRAGAKGRRHRAHHPYSRSGGKDRRPHRHHRPRQADRRGRPGAIARMGAGAGRASKTSSSNSPRAEKPRERPS